jgi:hypothetical protein
MVSGWFLDEIGIRELILRFARAPLLIVPALLRSP